MSPDQLMCVCVNSREMIYILVGESIRERSAFFFGLAENMFAVYLRVKLREYVLCAVTSVNIGGVGTCDTWYHLHIFMVA